MNTEIKEKIEQCLNCKTKPCTQGCPLGNNIPIFIKNAKEGKYKEAYDIDLTISFVKRIRSRYKLTLRQTYFKFVSEC